MVMTKKTLYFLKSAFPQMFEYDFYEGKTIYTSDEGYMWLAKKEMIDKNLDFFNPIILEFGVDIQKGDFFANIDKGTIHESSYFISVKPNPRDRSPNCLIKIYTHTKDLTDEQIEKILNGKLKHKNII